MKSKFFFPGKVGRFSAIAFIFVNWLVVTGIGLLLLWLEHKHWNLTILLEHTLVLSLIWLWFLFAIFYHITIVKPDGKLIIVSFVWPFVQRFDLCNLVSVSMVDAPTLWGLAHGVQLTFSDRKSKGLHLAKEQEFLALCHQYNPNC